MVDLASSTWSETASSNNATPPDGFPEGMAYAAVNDAARETMGGIKRAYNRDHMTVTSGGTSTAFTLTYSTSPGSWTQGMQFAFKVHTDCGSAPTVSPNSLTAKKLKKVTATGLSDLAANDLRAGQIAIGQYDVSTDAVLLFCVTADIPAAAAAVTPIGAVADYAGSSAPTGWLLCYGQAVSRTTYASLFAVISTTYGTGDGSTTFNLPDCRGRVTAGKDDMGGSSASRLTSTGLGTAATALGAVGGAETRTLAAANIPTLTISTSIQNNGTAGTANAVLLGTGTSGASTSVTTYTNASPTAVSDVQPTIVFNKIIYAGA